MLVWTKPKYNADGNADKSDHKVMQQANIINMINMITNKYETQQKHRLRTVS